MYKITPNLYYIIMKIRRFFQLVEFTFIALFLIIPPLFAKPLNTFNFSSTFSVNLFFYLAVALAVYFTAENRQSNHTPLFLKITMDSSYFFKSFGSLVLFASTLEFILVKLNLSSNFTGISADFSSLNKITVLLTFLVTCFYEEIIYRFYIPDFLISNVKFPKIVPEILSILIFALSHRYLGLAPVINAFFAGFVLRRCYLKSSSIITCFLAHFSYNIFMLYLYMH